jgi:CRP-like cAMP-binding protein
MKGAYSSAAIRIEKLMPGSHNRARIVIPISPREQGRNVHGQAVRNILLAQIPQPEFLKIRPHLDFVKLELGTQLQREGRPIAAAYFLNGGIASMIVETSDARSVEVGVAGREDMIGLQLTGGLTELTYSVVVQAPCTAFRVAADALRGLLPLMPELSRLLIHRLAIRTVEVAQNAACNRLHSIGQRLARWLLMAQDRINSDVISITHDFLSKIVGTDRATVSVKLEELERCQIVRRRRRSVAICDRAQLERRACECYRIVSQFNFETGLKPVVGGKTNRQPF